MSKVDKILKIQSPKESKKAMPKGFFRQKESLPEKKPELDYYELNLPEVNYIENIHQTRSIYSVA